MGHSCLGLGQEPRLGIRWFWGNSGNPCSTGYPTWLVIPPLLNSSILNGLDLDHTFAGKINDYLEGKIEGEDLMGITK